MRQAKVIGIAVATCLLWAFGSWIASAQSQNQKKASKETYTRPKPTVILQPTVPSANRYQNDKVFLEQADSLFRRRESFGEDEKQIVKGNVKFRQGNMWMYCDSAYYYPEINSLDAFGHVRMEQGDTLFVYADMLYYDGDARHARLRCGPTQRQVKLINRHTTLTTDSLDYDLIRELGWYDCGGKLDDRINTLTSLIGEYSPATKEADFYTDVVLERSSQGFKMLTDTLHYNTYTHIADILSQTIIESPSDTILTTKGYYNTQNGDAVLTARSTILHTDSTGNVITLTGDSIEYDRQRRISRAYSFMGKGKHPAPMVLNDTARKSILTGYYGQYDDSLRIAFATGYPLLMEFSRPDTLFLRADTIMTSIVSGWVSKPRSEEAFAADGAGFEGDSPVLKGDSVTITLPPDSVKRDFHVAKAYHRARFFNSTMQGIADSLVFLETDSTLFMYKRPIVWSGERQVSGNEIHVHFNDSTVDRAFLPDKGIMTEHVDEDFYNQLSGKEITAWFENQELKRLYIDGSVQAIFLPQDADSTYSKLVNAESSYLDIDMDSVGLHKLKMWPEVTGSVIPLFQIKKSDMYLPSFSWRSDLRPVREWYGDHLHWADDLGEVPEALDQWFSDEREDDRSFRSPRRANKDSMPLLPTVNAPLQGEEVKQ